MRASIRRLMPNTQWTRDTDGNRVKACTRCIKAKSKTGRYAVKTAKVAA